MNQMLKNSTKQKKISKVCSTEKPQLIYIKLFIKFIYQCLDKFIIQISTILYNFFIIYNINSILKFSAREITSCVCYLLYSKIHACSSRFSMKKYQINK